ncbi:uncharacterized protein METZ01_LOCUS516185, partial [marine metagenome]
MHALPEIYCDLANVFGPLDADSDFEGGKTDDVFHRPLAAQSSNSNCRIIPQTGPEWHKSSLH